MPAIGPILGWLAAIILGSKAMDLGGAGLNKLLGIKDPNLLAAELQAAQAREVAKGQQAFAREQDERMTREREEVRAEARKSAAFDRGADVLKFIAGGQSAAQNQVLGLASALPAHPSANVQMRQAARRPFRLAEFLA